MLGTNLKQNIVKVLSDFVSSFSNSWPQSNGTSAIFEVLCLIGSLWLARKKFHSNDNIKLETNAYFADIEALHYRTDTEMLEDRYITCITLDGDYDKE